VSTYSWTCPFCNSPTTITPSDYDTDIFRITPNTHAGRVLTLTHVFVCPNPKCKKFSLTVVLHEAKKSEDGSLYFPPGSSAIVPGNVIREWRLLPQSNAKPLPAYVPAPIVEDYNEACAIQVLSPKAAATLARRCLHQILRDFFKTHAPKLIVELESVKDEFDPQTWDAIHALIEVGNVGAHPEVDINVIVDVEPDEAGALIRLIEILINETYVARKRRETELGEVVKVSEDIKRSRQEQKNRRQGQTQDLKKSDGEKH